MPLLKSPHRRPARAQPICDWAEQNIHVLTGGRPGLIRLDAYQRALLEAIAHPDTREVGIMLSSQIGKSLLMSIALAWVIDQSPRAVLVMHPTATIGARWMREKLNDTIRAAPAVNAKVQRNRAGNLADTGFRFDGGYITNAASGSIGGVTGTTARLVLADEVDRYDSDLALPSLRQRMASSRDGCLVAMSTPTLTGQSAIEAIYQEGDQSEWLAVCPHCQQPQSAVWEQVTPDGYACRDCAVIWTEPERVAAVQAGWWSARNPSAAPARRSFWMPQVWSLNTPLSQTWADTRSYPEALISTDVMAQPWQDVVNEPPQRHMITRAEQAPFDIAWRTVGVDVQKDRLEASVVAFDRHFTAAHMERHLIVARTVGPECWRDFWLQVSSPWPGSGSVPVNRISVDGRYQHDWVTDGLTTQFGYHFTGNNAQVEVVKGASQSSFRKPLRQHRTTGARGFITVSSDEAKALIHDMIRRGGFTVSADIGEPQIDQLLAEKIVVSETRSRVPGSASKRTERWAKVSPGRRNEALDCVAYALCGAIDAPVIYQSPDIVVVNNDRRY